MAYIVKISVSCFDFSQFIMDSDGKTLPHAPQIRIIKKYWGILKMKVYEGNWSAKTRGHLIRRIKIKQQEIDQDIGCLTI
jgi:hypothetical protein